MTRPTATTGNQSRSAYGGARNARHIHEIRMPSGSLPVPPLEPFNLSQSRFNEALLFALVANFVIWGLLALAVWALFFKSY